MDLTWFRQNQWQKKTNISLFPTLFNIMYFVLFFSFRLFYAFGMIQPIIFLVPSFVCLIFYRIQLYFYKMQFQLRRRWDFQWFCQLLVSTSYNVYSNGLNFMFRKWKIENNNKFSHTIYSYVYINRYNIQELSHTIF